MSTIGNLSFMESLAGSPETRKLSAAQLSECLRKQDSAVLLHLQSQQHLKRGGTATAPFEKGGGGVEGGAAVDIIKTPSPVLASPEKFIPVRSPTRSFSPRKHPSEVPTTLSFLAKRAPLVPLGLNRWAVLLTFVFYAFLSGPVFLNWPVMQKLLWKQGAYSSYCGGVDNEIDGDDTCKAQRVAINNISPITTAAQYTCSFVAGLLTDIVGPKLCTSTGFVLSTIGWMMLALSSERVQLYLPGMMFVGLGSEPIYFGLLSGAKLFPGKQSLMLSLIGVGRGLCYFIPLLFQLLWSASATLNWSVLCWIMTGAMSVLLLSATVLVPWVPFTAVSLYLTQQHRLDVREKRKNTPLDAEDATAEAPDKLKSEPSLIPPTSTSSFTIIRAQMFDFLRVGWSPLFVPLLPVAAITIIRNNWIGTSATDQMSASGTNTLVYLNTFSFLLTTPIGWLADATSGLFVTELLSISATLSFLFLTLTSLFHGIASEVSGYLCAVFYCPIAAFMLSQIYCYVAEVFPPEHMGKLSGLACAVGGLLGLCSVAMYKTAADSGNFWLIDAILTGLSLFALGLCVFMEFEKRQYAKMAPQDYDFDFEDQSSDKERESSDLDVSNAELSHKATAF